MSSQDHKFVRNDANKKDGSSFSLRAAFVCAFRGLIYVCKSQRNAKIYLVFIVLAVALGCILVIPLSSWLAVVICIGLVIAAECINTALESVVDLVSPEYERLAQHAKDAAAAGVLVSAIMSLIIAVFVYGSALGEILN